ncbi:11-beta-hydroxysteroid dehydrogenase 1A-like [Aristolochia californica]|uniref:11-beta-hydroxysteroid dehydrogenase 1A-like n=1 Tax=Aristolochia californica TaxID=171875 RepID=UPI0035E2553F
MDALVHLTNSLFNWFLPPIFFFFSLLFLPSFYLFKLLKWLLIPRFPENMKSKVVIITGASSGVGEQIAYQYAKREALLVLVARREHALEQVAVYARKLGSPDVLVAPADVSKPDECREVIEKAVRYFGRINHLFTNAGFASFYQFTDIVDISRFTSIMDTNFWGSIYCTYYAIPHLRRSNGRIIVTASMVGLVPEPNFSIYNASKAALIQFYKTLRVELGSEVKITIVTPGAMESEFTKGKSLLKEGEMGIDEVGRDVILGPMPVEFGKSAAARIVDEVCKGASYVLTPPWVRVAGVANIIAPELLESIFSYVYRTGPGNDRRNTLSKRLADAGAKRFCYPESILSPKIKPN